MPLTRDFNHTVRARAQRDSAFRKFLLREALEVLMSGDVETGKILLRDYINATLGFAGLAELSRIPPKSLMRMFGADGNPRAENLFAVIELLQENEGVRFELRSRTA